MWKRRPKSTRRTPEQRRAHYEIETRLADQLRRASKEERRRLYTALYDELFRRVPHHPLLTRKSDPSGRLRRAARQTNVLMRFLGPETLFLEVGAGDCLLSLEVAKHVRQVYTVDVSTEITSGLSPPENFELIISDGTSIDVASKSIDVVFSDQLMEHLHPDDAREQLQNIFEALAPGGVYVCITPNRLNGPHDISRLCDRVARGFHLEEYTNRQLKKMFKEVGFSKFSALVGLGNVGILLPTFPIEWIEWVLGRLPYRLRTAIARLGPMRLLLGVSLVARAPQ